MRTALDEMKVGAVVVVSVVILVIGIMWLKSYRFGQQYDRWTVVFPTVGTLKTGDPVKVRGVLAGTIDEIDLVEGGVAVSFNIRNDVVLHPDAQILCSNLGVMGDRFIDVLPGETPGELARDPMPKGVYQPGVSDIADQVALLVERTEELIEVVSVDIRDEGTRQSIRNTVRNAEVVTREAAEFMERNSASLGHAAQDLAATLSHTRKFFDEHSTELGRAVDEAAMTVAAARSVVEAADRIVVVADSAAAAVSDRRGTAGKILFDTELYDALLRAVADADSLIVAIRANPKDFLSLRVF